MADWKVMKVDVTPDTGWIMWREDWPVEKFEQFNTHGEAYTAAFTAASDEMPWEEIAAKTLLHYAKTLVPRPHSVFMVQDAQKLIGSLV